MPVWISDTEIDPEWIQDKTKSFLGQGRTIVHCSVQDISINTTRKGVAIRNGATLKLQVTFQSNQSTTLCLVIKQIPADSGRRTLSQQLGLAREALFYE